MCGRYTLSTVDGPDLAQRFGLIKPPEEETLGRFNVCPTETVAAVLEPNEAAAVQWGLRPFRSQNYAPINVRSETAGTRYKRLMDGGRCLVLADGWYEWLKSEKPAHARGERLPFRYTVDGGEPFAFAGLWRRTRVGGELVHSALILTCPANAVAAPVHDRMPCVLAGPDEEAAWLEGDPDGLLLPLDPERTSVAPANPAVNKAGVEGPELLIAEPPPQLSFDA